MFQWNSFYRYSDESVDERNRWLLTTECHNKQDNMHFPFIFSNFENVTFKACLYIYLKKRYFPLYIMLCMILQLGGLGNLIIGITAAAAAGNSVNVENKNGKLDFLYQ